MSEPLSATELVAAYRAGERSPVEEAEAALARIEERDGELNAFCLVDADAALTGARASEARWAPRRAGRPARRRAGRREGPAGHRGLADAARLDDDRPGRAVGRRRAGRRLAAPLRRRAARQDDDAGAGLEGRHRQRADRRHPQPVGPAHDPGRLERRQLGGARGRDGPAGARHRRRRLDPDPVRVLRAAGPQADVRPACRPGRRARSGRSRTSGRWPARSPISR